MYSPYPYNPPLVAARTPSSSHMGWLTKLVNSPRRKLGASSGDGDGEDEPPPAWTPAPEPSRAFGLKNEAPEDEYTAAEDFCLANPAYAPRFLPSSDVERIREEGCRAWSLLPPSLSRFRGSVRDIVRADRLKGASKVVEVCTERGCGDTCLLSNYPLMAGLYDVQGKEGVYYEVTILQMEGVVAVGTACLPYPEYRLPGWNRLSAGLHLDDMHKFFEDPDGGRPYSPLLSPSPIVLRTGDTIGVGYVFASGALFFTYNGERLADAFGGVYLPRAAHDVYAAVGVGGPGANRLRVNFGGDVDGEDMLRWLPGREWAWRVEGHVGRFARGVEGEGEELPGYCG